ncbi:hypothetical protein AMAG_06117 [Allomyces macrogynus ATCC 38327]|uniref:Uncharacterized protein n=1 Tax=Allomyces macrogynus (strain ATCC 38327) TaxID=578462 RepID=A0A0L0SE52_ALLM3|nr:hypothetical protein AMAG_06117 [Allomyces macrogynus ATCC 38327]|eukprot:KNE60761.1 hypothetical protein AMAG_06117 [Allomyces macrogynus ATCC 38327]
MSAAAAAALRAAYPSAPRTGATTTTKFEASRTRISKHGQTTHDHRAARTSATVQAARGATPVLVHDMQYVSTRAGDVVVESGRRYYGAMPAEPRPAIAPTGTVPERGSGSSAGPKQIPIGLRHAASTTRVRAHAETERTAEQTAYVPAPAPAQAAQAVPASSAYAKYVAQPGKVLPPVFIRCALLPSAYALTRTAPDVCEFKAVVPPPPGTPAAAAAAALARKSLARQRALAASRRTSRYAAVPSNPTSSLDTELVDELASLPGHWPGTPATGDDDDLPPMHPWGSEFLLLHYCKGEKPEVVRRDMIADGLPVMLLARHGDLGLWRDRLEANPGDTAAAAEVQARLAAPDMAPQFIGVKDTGALFSISHPTTKTIFRVARVSSKGFALRADVGAYLCVADYMLALRHDFVPAECTFRFVFVPEPLDALWPRANMAPLARQSIPRVIATTPASAAPSAASKNAYPTPSTPSNVYQAPMPAAAVAAEATAVVAEQQYQHQMQNHVRFEQQQHEHHHHQQQQNQVMTTTTTKRIPITMPAAVAPATAGEASIGAPPRNDSLTPAPQVLAAVAAAVSAQTGGPPPAPRRAGTASAAAAKAMEAGKSKPSALARLCTAVAVQDCKGRYLIRERLGAWNMKPRGSHYDADDAAEDDEVDQIDVLRLSNAKTKEDERILYFEMLMLPARDKVTADSGAGMDFVDRCRTLTNDDLELAKPFDPVQGPGHRVLFKCGDKYLAVRMPTTYNPDDVTGRTSKDMEEDDEDDDSRINGTLILVSRPSIGAVFVYHKAQHHPLPFSLQSVPLGTYVTVSTPPAGQVVGLVHMQAAYLHARQLVLGGGRSASAAAAAASSRVTALRAQARAPGKREFMTLVVPQSLAQALTTQSLKGPSKHATYLTAAITGAALLGSAAGIVNMVINANRQQAVSGSGSTSGSGTKSTFIDPTNSQGAGATTAAPTVAGADHASGAHLMAGDAAAAPGQVPATGRDTNALQGTDACPTTTGEVHACSTVDYGTRIDFPDQWQSNATDAAQTGGSAYYLPDVPSTGYYQTASGPPTSGHDTTATIAVPRDPVVTTTTTVSPAYAPWPPEGPGPAVPDAPRTDTTVTAPWPPEGPGPAVPDAACIDTSVQQIHIADATAAQVVVPDAACGGGFHAEIHAALHAQFDVAMTVQYQHQDPSAMEVYVDAAPCDMGPFYHLEF